MVKFWDSSLVRLGGSTGGGCGYSYKILDLSPFQVGNLARGMATLEFYFDWRRINYYVYHHNN